MYLRAVSGSVFTKMARRQACLCLAQSIREVKLTRILGMEGNTGVASWGEVAVTLETGDALLSAWSRGCLPRSTRF